MQVTGVHWYHFWSVLWYSVISKKMSAVKIMEMRFWHRDNKCHPKSPKMRSLFECYKVSLALLFFFFLFFLGGGGNAKQCCSPCLFSPASSLAAPFLFSVSWVAPTHPIAWGHGVPPQKQVLAHSSTYTGGCQQPPSIHIHSGSAQCLCIIPARLQQVRY